MGDPVTGDAQDTFIDVGQVMRGAFRGLLVLFVGELAVVVLAGAAPLLGPIGLQAVALIAFVVAAWATAGPRVAGSLAAGAAYLLVVPLMLIAGAPVDVLASTLTLLAALLVGFVARIVKDRGRGEDVTRRARRG